MYIKEVKKSENMAEWFKQYRDEIIAVIISVIFFGGSAASIYKDGKKVEVVTAGIKITDTQLLPVFNPDDETLVMVEEEFRAYDNVSRGGDYHNYRGSKIVVPETVEVNTGVGKGEFKSFMDYRAITTDSVQGQYIANNMIVQADGLLVDQAGYIGVAMGSAYGPIGSKYLVTLESGNTVKVVKVEAKSDRHTYGGHVDKNNGSVIEFVVDVDYIKGHGDQFHEAYKCGSFDVYPQFGGKIIKIEEVIGEKEYNTSDATIEIAKEQDGKVKVKKLTIM